MDEARLTNLLNFFVKNEQVLNEIVSHLERIYNLLNLLNKLNKKSLLIKTKV